MRNNLLLFSIIVFFFLTTGLHAQIPNSGFENWTSNDPDGWATSNVFVGSVAQIQNITKSSDAHGGSAAVKGEVVTFYTITYAPMLQSGTGGTGFAFTQRPKTVTGWLKTSFLQSDRFTINIILYKNSTPVAIAANYITANYSTYTQFSVDFSYLTADIPDNCIAQFMIVGSSSSSSSPHIGSYYILDDIAFSGTVPTDVAASKQIPVQFNLEQNYPNPFNPSTKIKFSLPERSNVSLNLYNLIGEKVGEILNQSLEAGNHEVLFNANKLTSGIYFYKLVAGSSTSIRKMILMK
jgi:hypothetical protein